MTEPGVTATVTMPAPTTSGATPRVGPTAQVSPYLGAAIQGNGDPTSLESGRVGCSD